MKVEQQVAKEHLDQAQEIPAQPNRYPPKPAARGPEDEEGRRFAAPAQSYRKKKKEKIDNEIKK